MGCRRKVNKILQTNGNMPQEQLENIAREKGGTNGVAAAIYVIVIIVLSVLIATLYAMILSTMTSVLL